MTLHAMDEIVCTRDLRGRLKGRTVQRGTHGVVVSHWGNDMLPIYRVRFSLPGQPCAVLDDLTEADIAQFGEPSRLAR